MSAMKGVVFTGRRQLESETESWQRMTAAVGRVLQTA